MTISFTIPGEAVPFARAGSSGKRRFTPKRQADFMAAVRLFGSRAMEGKPPLAGAVMMTADFVHVWPSSWSAKKREANKWKTSRGDLDNLCKIIGDSLNGIAFVDDAQVAVLTASKVYGDRSEVRVTMRELP